MFTVYYQFTSQSPENELSFQDEQKAYAEALDLLKQGYIVQVTED